MFYCKLLFKYQAKQKPDSPSVAVKKAVLTRNGENSCFRKLTEKMKASTLRLLPFVRDTSQKNASSMVSKLLISV